jgi:hypothetical protein
MTELRVNPAELRAGASGLESAANSIPEPLAPFTATGADALSAILSTLTQEKESSLIAGMPATKAEALANARKALQAAGIYEQTDQQIADEIRKATEGLDSAAGGAPGGGGVSGAGGVGTPGAGGANPAGGAGQAGQLQQMMGMPMQVAQQAGQMAQQVPQGIMQGVQSGMQQVGQLAGGLGQKDDSQASDDGQRPEQAQDEKPEDRDKAQPTALEGAAPGQSNAGRAPEAAPQTGATPDTSQSDPVPEAAPPKPAPTGAAPSDPGIVV